MQHHKIKYDYESSSQTFHRGNTEWLSRPTACKLNPGWRRNWSTKEVKGHCKVEITGQQTRVVHVSRLKTSGAANNHSFHGSLNKKLLSTRLESISVDYVTTTTSSTRMAKHFTPHIQALTCRCCTLSGETLTAVSPYIHGKWTTLSRTSTSFIMNGAWLKSTVEGMSFLIAESQS